VAAWSMAGLDNPHSALEWGSIYQVEPPPKTNPRAVPASGQTPQWMWRRSPAPKTTLLSN